MDELERELKVGFLEEATQLLDDCEESFLQLEMQGSRAADSVIENIFRAVHNIKGTSAAVGFEQMGVFCHTFESLLLKIKNKQIAVSTSIVSTLLNGNDHLGKMVASLKMDLAARFDSAEIIASLQDHIDGKVSAEEAVPTESQFDSIMAEEALAQPEANLAKASSPAIAAVVPGGKKEAIRHQDETIRVNLSRMEMLLNGIGELVILEAVLNQQKALIPSSFIQKTISQLAKVTKDIRDISMSLRMVPVKPTFKKMQRIVRDTSKLTGKEVILETSGDETELDKTVLEHLSDPLVHLIRNAVDHGIEDPAERKLKGKPVVGTIKLKAYHQGGHIVIEARDDGKGLDAKKLREKAIQKGLISESDILSEQECFQLIFRPGFSTKAEVTEISGRGVGLDVVKTNVERLHGEIQVSTELGQGSCFKMLLPITLAIIDGLVLKLGNERYVIPIVSVHETVKPNLKDIFPVSGMGVTFSLRGEVLPLYGLAALLGRKSALKNVDDGIVIVVRTNQDKPFTFLVDDIIGLQQVVIKKLGKEADGLKGIIGSTILGDGKPALILEISDLVQAQSKSVPHSTETLRGVA